MIVFLSMRPGSAANARPSDLISLTAASGEEHGAAEMLVNVQDSATDSKSNSIQPQPARACSCAAGLQAKGSARRLQQHRNPGALRYCHPRLGATRSPKLHHSTT